MKTVGERVSEAIRESGESLTAIADIAGLDKSYLSRIANNKAGFHAVSVGIARALARVLNVELMWLIEEKGPKRPGEALQGRGISDREASKLAAVLLRIPSHIVEAVQAKYSSTAYDAKRYDPKWWTEKYWRAIRREKARQKHSNETRRRSVRSPSDSPEAESPESEEKNAPSSNLRRRASAG